MIQKKLALSQDVMRIVRDICALVFNVSSDEQLEKVFGITALQMETVIKTIINALPNSIFEHTYPGLLEEIKNICAREFIFFQVQEKGNRRYQEDLSKFILIFSRDIQQRIEEEYKLAQSKLKEE